MDITEKLRSGKKHRMKEGIKSNLGDIKKNSLQKSPREASSDREKVRAKSEKYTVVHGA